jgi:hypothetical protein
MDELQSGPLMVKSLTRRHFVDWVILEEWLEDPFSHYCFIMIDKVYNMDELQSGPLMVKALTGRCFVE